MEGGALSDSPPTLWCFKHSCMKVHMAVLIAGHEGGLGTYTVYSVIPSYPAGNKKLVATLLVSHKVPLNNCNKTSSHSQALPMRESQVMESSAGPGDKVKSYLCL